MDALGPAADHRQRVGFRKRISNDEASKEEIWVEDVQIKKTDWTQGVRMI